MIFGRAYLAALALLAITACAPVKEPPAPGSATDIASLYDARGISVGGQQYLVQLRQMRELAQITVSHQGKTASRNLDGMIFSTELAVSRAERQFQPIPEDRREAGLVAAAYCNYLKFSPNPVGQRGASRFVALEPPQNNEWVFESHCRMATTEGEP